MLHGHCNNNKIKQLHERYLRLICCDKTSSDEKLPEKDGSVSIHYRNIQNLAIEMYNVKNEVVSIITANVSTATPEISVIILFLDYLLQEQFTMALKYLISRTKNMRYCFYGIKKCPIF